jgi:hypothetical protein
VTSGTQKRTPREDAAEQLYREHARRHKGIFGDIVFERIRQESKWGLQEHGPLQWLAILAEEFGEAAMAVNEVEAGRITPAVLENLRAEIVQTAAVAVAWLDDWDRREMFSAGG